MTIKGLKGEGMYFGQWSAKTKKPHGKGIFWAKFGPFIGYFENGALDKGRSIDFGNEKSDKFCLGNKTDDTDGDSTDYYQGGKIERS